VYLMIKELENDNTKAIEKILKQSEDYYLNKELKKVNLLADEEILKHLSKHLIFLDKKSIQYMLKKLSFLNTSKEQSFFSFELLKEQISLKNNGFIQIFNLDKLKLLIGHIDLETLKSLSEEKFDEFFIFLLSRYDLEKEEKELIKLINILTKQYKLAHQKVFELNLNYEIKDTYVKEAPNAFEQILINLTFDNKKLPLSLFECLLKLIAIHQPKAIKFENVIPLYSLSFNLVDEPILALEKLHKKLAKLKDKDYEGSLEKNMLSILAISDINFFSYSDIMMKIIEQKLTLPLSEKALKNTLIEQKLIHYTEVIKIKNSWTTLTQAEKTFYLSLRKVENKIKRQQQSQVMDTEELVKSFAPFKTPTLDIPLKEKLVNKTVEEPMNIEEILSKAFRLDYNENVLTLEPEDAQHRQIEAYDDEIKHLENAELTQEIENFFYAKESLKKWVDSQDVINKKIYYFTNPLSQISPSLYAKLILSDDMLKEGILYLSNKSEVDLINEYQKVIENLVNQKQLSKEDKLHLDKKMGI
jgi:hypothetical protein